jgi:hypothetical protein
MFTKVQNETPNVKLCVAIKNEKPLDDIHDYMEDLGPQYPLNFSRESTIES